MKKENELEYNYNEPCFFVFTCIKDGRGYIPKLFESMLSQTKTNFIHYIYEDGSDDPICDLVFDYKEKASKLLKPFKVIYENNTENIGLNMATKHCISKCRAPYFIWIDCDNWIDSGFFENLTSFIRLHQDGIVFSSYGYRVIKDNHKVYSPFDNKYIIKRTTFQNKSMLLMSGLYTHSVFAVDYKKYLAINPENELVSEKSVTNDLQVLLNCSLAKCNFYFVKNCISFQTMRKDSVSQTIDSGSKLLDYFELFIEEKHLEQSSFKDYLEIGKLVKNILKLDYSKKKIELIKAKRKILKKQSIPYSIGFVEHSDLFFFVFSSFLKPIIRIRRLFR